MVSEDRIDKEPSRAGESGDAHFFRSDARIFYMNCEWCFGAREGDQGPYGTEDLAELEMERYLKSCRLLDQRLSYKKIAAKTKKPELV